MHLSIQWLWGLQFIWLFWFILYSWVALLSKSNDSHLFSFLVLSFLIGILNDLILDQIYLFLYNGPYIHLISGLVLVGFVWMSLKVLPFFCIFFISNYWDKPYGMVVLKDMGMDGVNKFAALGYFIRLVTHCIHSFISY